MRWDGPAHMRLDGATDSISWSVFQPFKVLLCVLPGPKNHPMLEGKRPHTCLKAVLLIRDENTEAERGAFSKLAPLAGLCNKLQFTEY